MEFTCVQRLGLDLPFAAEERNVYGQRGGLEPFRQLACNPSLQSGYSTTFELDSAGALEMNDYPSFDKVGMGEVSGTHQLDPNDLFAHPHFGNVVDNGHQMQPGVFMDTNMTNSMPDLWSLFSDTSSWTDSELCSLSSDELHFVNHALPHHYFNASSTAPAQQQQPCTFPHSIPAQQQPPLRILSHSDATQAQPLTYLCCPGPQDQINSQSNSERRPSKEIRWRNSDAVGGLLKPFGDAFVGNNEISSVTVSAVSSEDSSENVALNSFMSAPQVPATSVNDDFHSTNCWVSEGPRVSGTVQTPDSWTSGVPQELRTGSASSVAAISHLAPIPDALLSSLEMGTDNVLLSSRLSCKSQKVKDGSPGATGRMLNSYAMPSLSPSSYMPSLLGNRDSDLRHSSSSLEFAGERFKDIESPFPPTLPKLTAAVHPIDEGVASNMYSDQKPQNFKLGRKQTATSIEPQSVAARHRRKRISERVRILESHIPGGSKLDTASMLDESIEFVKFLQLQVHLLESLDSSGPGPEWSSSEACGIGDGASASLQPNASRGSVPNPVARSSGCPLILSEVLQQQLFKQRLCLVSLSQTSAERNF